MYSYYLKIHLFYKHNSLFYITLRACSLYCIRSYSIGTASVCLCLPQHRELRGPHIIKKYQDFHGTQLP